MEGKITTNFEAKTEQKINYPPDFGGLQRAGGIFLTQYQFYVLGYYKT